MNYDTVKRKTLPEQTADALAAMLYMENYSYGAKLPNEIELAKRFEVSRSTVRQAIRILCDRELLSVRRGSGTFFMPVKCMDNDPLGISQICNREQLAKDLLSLRLMIEPEAALLASQNASRKDIALLYQICDEMEKRIEMREDYLEKDMAFHQAVANASGNVVIPNLIPYIHQMQLLRNSFSSKKQKEKTLHEHRRIAEAIGERRGADAYQMMQYHLMAVQEQIKK